MTETLTTRIAAPPPGGGLIRMTRGTVVMVHGRYFYLPNSGVTPLPRPIDLAGKVRQ